MTASLVDKGERFIGMSSLRNVKDGLLFAYSVNLINYEEYPYPPQGTKLTFLARSHLAPKFSKVVAKSKKLVAIFKKKIVEKTHSAIMSN